MRDYIDRCQYGNKRGGPWFTNRRIGSLELTRRLEIAYKLEGHEGCVNALHFDPEGSLLASGSDDKVSCYAFPFEVRTGLEMGHF